MLSFVVWVVRSLVCHCRRNGFENDNVLSVVLFYLIVARLFRVQLSMVECSRLRQARLWVELVFCVLFCVMHAGISFWRLIDIRAV